MCSVLLLQVVNEMILLTLQVHTDTVCAACERAVFFGSLVNGICSLEAETRAQIPSKYVKIVGKRGAFFSKLREERTLNLMRRCCFRRDAGQGPA